MLLPPALYTTFPAGRLLPPGVGGLLKGLGLKAGFPDILLFKPRRCIGIELKAGSSASSAQREMHAKLKACDVDVYICRSLEEVAETLHREAFPLRRGSTWGKIHGEEVRMTSWR